MEIQEKTAENVLSHDFFFSAKKEKADPYVYKCVCLFQDEQIAAEDGGHV